MSGPVRRCRRWCSPTIRLLFGSSIGRVGIRADDRQLPANALADRARVERGEAERPPGVRHAFRGPRRHEQQAVDRLPEVQLLVGVGIGLVVLVEDPVTHFGGRPRVVAEDVMPKSYLTGRSAARPSVSSSISSSVRLRSSSSESSRSDVAYCRHLRARRSRARPIPNGDAAPHPARRRNTRLSRRSFGPVHERNTIGSPVVPHASGLRPAVIALLEPLGHLSAATNPSSQWPGESSSSGAGPAAAAHCCDSPGSVRPSHRRARPSSPNIKGRPAADVPARLAPASPATSVPRHAVRQTTRTASQQIDDAVCLRRRSKHGQRLASRPPRARCVVESALFRASADRRPLDPHGRRRPHDHRWGVLCCFCQD